MAILTFNEAYTYLDSCKIRNLSKEKIVEIILSDEFLYYHSENEIEARFSMLELEWDDFKQFFDGKSNSLVHAIIDDEYTNIDEDWFFPSIQYKSSTRYKYILKKDVVKYKIQEYLMNKYQLDDRSELYSRFPVIYYISSANYHGDCIKKVTSITLDEHGSAKYTYGYYSIVPYRKVCDENQKGFKVMVKH